MFFCVINFKQRFSYCEGEKMTVNNVYLHFRKNIERARKHSVTNTDVSGNNRLVLSLEKSYLHLHWSRVG